MVIRPEIVLVDRHANGPRQAALRSALAGIVFDGTIRVIEPGAPTASVAGCLCVLEYRDPADQSAPPLGGGYLLVDPGVGPDGEPHFTGVDVVAYLLSGVAGVIDVTAMPMPNTLDEIVRHARAQTSRTQALLVGAPVDRLRRLSRAVDDLPGDIDSVCFRAACALAQLPVLRPTQLGRRSYGFPAFADGLNAQAGRTGFNYNVNTLQRALSQLARMWAPAEELWGDGDPGEVDDLTREPPGLDDEARELLPQLARQAGFPLRLPVVAGLLPADVAGRLYSFLTRLTIREPHGETAGYAFTIVDHPRR